MLSTCAACLSLLLSHPLLQHYGFIIRLPSHFCFLYIPTVCTFILSLSSSLSVWSSLSVGLLNSCIWAHRRVNPEETKQGHYIGRLSSVLKKKSHLSHISSLLVHALQFSVFFSSLINCLTYQLMASVCMRLGWNFYISYQQLSRKTSFLFLQPPLLVLTSLSNTVALVFLNCFPWRSELFPYQVACPLLLEHQDPLWSTSVGSHCAVSRHCW